MGNYPTRVEKDGKVGVFLSSRYEGENGEGAAKLLIAVNELKQLEGIANLTGPKFMEAMSDGETQKRLRKAIQRFCLMAHSVGVISVRPDRK